MRTLLIIMGVLWALSNSFRSSVTVFKSQNPKDYILLNTSTVLNWIILGIIIILIITKGEL
jgi:hypothetical protein